MSVGKANLENYVPTLKFICSKYHDSWLTLSALFEEEGKFEDAIKAMQSFLELQVEDLKAALAWQQLAKLYRQRNDWQADIQATVEFCLVPNIAFSDLSNSANWLNRLFNEHKSAVDNLEKRLSVEKVASVFETRIKTESLVSGDDYSRLAWLFRHLNDHVKAKKIVAEGLKVDPQNIYCLKLMYQLL